MKEIREVLERYVYSDKYIGYKKVDQAEAEIKKLVLDMVENSTVEFEISSVKYGIDSLISKAEIRKKIEGEL